MRQRQTGRPRSTVCGLVKPPAAAPTAPPTTAPASKLPPPVTATSAAPVPAPIRPPETARSPGRWPHAPSITAQLIKATRGTKRRVILTFSFGKTIRRNNDIKPLPPPGHVSGDLYRQDQGEYSVSHRSIDPISLRMTRISSGLAPPARLFRPDNRNVMITELFDDAPEPLAGSDHHTGKGAEPTG